MSSLPPPIYVPPPYQAPRRVSPTSIAVLTLLGILVFVLLLFGLASIATRWGRAKDRAKSNPSVVGKATRDGWGLYHIDALQLSLKSFTVPKARQGIEAVIASRRDVSECAQYKMENPGLHVRITAYWLRSTFPRRDPSSSLSSNAKFEKLNMERSVPTFTSSGVIPVSINGFPARLITVQFPYKHFDWVTRCAVVVRGSSIYYVEGEFWKSKTNWGERAFNYMLNSIKFDAGR